MKMKDKKLSGWKKRMDEIRNGDRHVKVKYNLREEQGNNSTTNTSDNPTSIDINSKGGIDAALRIKQSYEDAQIQIQIEMADDCYMMHEFDKALQAYQKVSNTFDQNDAKNLQDMADVHVKISNIHQVKGELSQALGYLQRAYQSYNECLHSATAVIDNQKQQQFLALKIVEVTCGIANIYIDQGETEKSSYKYKDAIKICKDSSVADDILVNTLLNYGNFQSICMQDHVGAIESMKEALKTQLQSSQGAMNRHSASILSSMGKVFLRRSNASNSDEGIKDSQRAEACFLRALQVFKLSMIGNGNEKVVDTLCYLNEARQRIKMNKGILRKVRFDATAADVFSEYEFSSGSESDSFESDQSSLTDIRGVQFNDYNKKVFCNYKHSTVDGQKAWYDFLGGVNIIDCGKINGKPNHI